MTEKDDSYFDLATADARAAFREAHQESVYHAAISLTDTRAQADILTEMLFRSMEERFEHNELPYAIDIYMLAQLNLLYAENRQKIIKESANAAASQREPQPPSDAPVAEDAQKRRVRKIVAVSKASPRSDQPPAQPMKEESPAPVAPSSTRQPSGETPSPVMATPQPPLARPASKPSAPAASSSLSAMGKPALAPAAAIPQAPIATPSVVQSPYPTAQVMQQVVAAPTLLIPVMPFSAQYVNPMAPSVAPMSVVSPMGVMPPMVPGAPMQQANPQPEEDEEEEEQELPLNYNPNITEFWNPNESSADAEEAAPVPEPAKPSKALPAVKPVPPPPLASVPEPEPEDDTHSAPIAILNTVLLLSVLAAIAFLLMELNVLPKLF